MSETQAKIIAGEVARAQREALRAQAAQQAQAARQVAPSFEQPKPKTIIQYRPITIPRERIVRKVVYRPFSVVWDRIKKKIVSRDVMHPTDRLRVVRAPALKSSFEGTPKKAVA